MIEPNRRVVVAGLAAFIATPALAAWPERSITITHGLGRGGGVEFHGAHPCPASLALAPQRDRRFRKRTISLVQVTKTPRICGAGEESRRAVRLGGNRGN